MGLLDGILSSVLGNLGNMGGAANTGTLRPGDSDNPLGSALGRMGGSVAASALVALAFRVLQQNGGIGGLVDKLRDAGLGQHASSWVGTDDNIPVDADQLKSAFGADQLAQLASQLGLTADQASRGLAQVLPDLVNQMTPSGEVPANDRDLISDALATLRRVS
jgi:uncharacterized protein YidB (DUF937 family)